MANLMTVELDAAFSLRVKQERSGRTRTWKRRRDLAASPSCRCCGKRLEPARALLVFANASAATLIDGEPVRVLLPATNRELLEVQVVELGQHAPIISASVWDHRFGKHGDGLFCSDKCAVLFARAAAVRFPDLWGREALDAAEARVRRGGVRR